MVRRSKSVSEVSVFTPAMAEATLTKAMAIYVGRGRKWSFEDLAVATGIPATNLRAYCNGSRRPSYPSLASLCGVLGGEFTTRLFQPVGIGAFDIPDEGDDIGETVSTLADATSTAARHRIDGVLDHVERAIEARDLGPKLIAEGGRMIRRAA